MPRTRRFIRAGKPHELDIRVKSGLPFACFNIVKLLLESAMARTQRDQKVTISSNVWNGNHLHMILIPHDAQICVNFYQEMQKKITEYMKRLLGVSRLNLWEGDPILAEIQDLDKAVERFVYHYANPADADLVETIDEFPGLSSWNDFLNADTTVDARCARLVPWIRLPSIAPLVNLALTPEEDLALCASLVEGATEKHELVIYPYAWIKCFGPTTPEEVAKIRERIIEGVRAREEVSRKRRAAAGKKVMGRERLLKQPIMAPHTPPPRERRVYFLGSSKEARIARVAETQEFNRICEKCRRKS